MDVSSLCPPKSLWPFRKQPVYVFSCFPTWRRELQCCQLTFVGGDDHLLIIVKTSNDYWKLWRVPLIIDNCEGFHRFQACLFEHLGGASVWRKCCMHSIEVQSTVFLFSYCIFRFVRSSCCCNVFLLQFSVLGESKLNEHSKDSRHFQLGFMREAFKARWFKMDWDGFR